VNVSNYDPSDTIADGLAVYAVITNDHSAVDDGALIYRTLSRRLREVMRPGDSCSAALPAMILNSNLRAACFVAILQDRVLIAYQRGLFRKTSEVIVIPTSTITDVRGHIGSTGSAKGASLITFAGDPTASIAVPSTTAATSISAIQQALNPASR
jgi:hypothetical protein